MSTTFGKGDALPTVEKLISQDQIERYAEASGDFNPIHVDHEFAAGSRFRRTIAHGMMVSAAISEMMTLAFAEDWLRSGRLKLRFRAPVYPGERVRTVGRIKGAVERDAGVELSSSVGVRKESGEDAITGEATVVVRKEG